MLSIKCLEKSLIWCLFPINVFESKLDGSVFRVICRLYTEMRCDYVNYGYFIYLLDRLKFGESRKWVWISIWTIRFSIMVNRTTIFFSNSSRGLRQLGPFSMPLLILVMEVNNMMLRKAVEGGNLAAFQVEGESEGFMESSNLLFAHDTMLFVT